MVFSWTAICRRNSGRFACALRLAGVAREPAPYFSNDCVHCRESCRALMVLRKLNDGHGGGAEAQDPRGVDAGGHAKADGVDGSPYLGHGGVYADLGLEGNLDDAGALGSLRGDGLGHSHQR